MARVTKKEAQDRATFVIALIATGLRATEIVEHEKVKGWGISEAQVYRYIRKAHTFFEERADINRNAELGATLEKYDHLYSKLVKARDYRGAAQVLDKRSELIGLKKLLVGVETKEPVVIKWKMIPGVAEPDEKGEPPL